MTEMLFMGVKNTGNICIVLRFSGSSPKSVLLKTAAAGALVIPA